MRVRASALCLALLLPAACGDGAAPAIGSSPAVLAPKSPPAPAPAAPAAAPTATEDPPGPPKSALVRALDRFHAGDGRGAARMLEDIERDAAAAPRDREWARGWMPFALVLSGDTDAAIRRVESMLPGKDRDAEVGLRALLGDLQSASGDVDAAIETFRALRTSIQRKDADQTIPYTTLLEVEVKLALLGRTLPDLEPKWIAGAESFDPAGRVTVLVCFSPYVPCESGVAAARRLLALPSPPFVAGVVASDADEHVPGPFEIPREEWPKPDKDTHAAVDAWRTSQKLAIPVVGATPGALPGDVTMFHCDVVVSREGRIVHVATQSDADTVIELAAVRRLMRD